MSPISNGDGRLRKPLVTFAGSTVANEPLLKINFHGRLKRTTPLKIRFLRTVAYVNRL
jgi:hypothetical protein